MGVELRCLEYNREWVPSMRGLRARRRPPSEAQRTRSAAEGRERKIGRWLREVSQRDGETREGPGETREGPGARCE